VTDTFATIGELRNYLQRDDLGPTGVLDLEIATGLIQELTGQTIFRVDDDVVVLNGRSGGSIYLPQIPVIDVTVLNLDGNALDLVTDFDVDSRLGILTRLPLGAFWTRGLSNITVTYSHGWDDPPPPIRGLCLKWAGKLWQNPTGLKTERTASYSATYAELIDDDDWATLSLYAMKTS
jgi:hypothetical protein